MASDDRYAALCEGRWELAEQTAVIASPDYLPDPPVGSLDDPYGPTLWDMR